MVHPSPTPWGFEMWFDFENPGSLHHIDVSPPGGATPFTIYEDAGYWDYESPALYSSLSALLVWCVEFASQETQGEI